MRLVYTLLASGFLIFAEVPAEKLPPLVLYDATFYTGSLKAASAQVAASDDSIASDSGASHSATSHLATGSSPKWHLDSSPDSYLGLPIDLFFTQPVQENFEPRKPPALSGERSIHDGPILLPSDYVPPPTPLPSWAVDDAWLVSYDQPSLLPVTGVAMYYNPEVMQEVLSNRLAMGHVSACPECIGNVALLRAGDLNRRVWLQWADGMIEGPFLVVDVAAPQHIAQLLARNWVVDVDYRTALRRSMVNPVAVTVLDAPPEPSQQESSQQASSPFAPLYSPLPTPDPWPIPTSGPTP